MLDVRLDAWFFSFSTYLFLLVIVVGGFFAVHSLKLGVGRSRQGLYLYVVGMGWFYGGFGLFRSSSCDFYYNICDYYSVEYRSRSRPLV